MMIRKSIRLFLGCLSLLLLVACGQKQTRQKAHYFLKGYDELQFRTKKGVVVHPAQYIRAEQRNGFRMYAVLDTSLTLVHKRTDEPYTGYIRTFHRDRYNLNLQGEFKEGRMYRLRYWHPNRVLGMDADYRDNTLSMWSSNGKIVVESHPEETYYYYSGRNAIKEIINDTMRSHFDKRGNLERYTIYNDTARIVYSPGGQKIESYTYQQEKNRYATYKEWYSNGQLKIEGNFRNGREAGSWTRYDSLGNITQRKKY